MSQHSVRDEGKAIYRTARAIAPSEHSEQAKVFAWAKRNWCVCHELDELMFSTLNGISLGGSKASRGRTITKMKAEGMKVGVPDIFLMVARQSWHGLAIELKRQDGTLSDEQVWWLDKLTEQGYLATACWGAREAISVLAEYMDIEGWEE